MTVQNYYRAIAPSVAKLLRQPLLWLFIGAVGFTVWLYYPGYMSFDAFDQLRQARANVYEDWHPPIAAFIWRELDQTVPGPGLMMLWQNLMFWGGLALILGGVRRWRAVVLMVVVGFWIPIFASLGTLWKDTALASALLFSVGLLAYTYRTGRRWTGWGALLPIFYAVALRHNALPAVLPLLLWWWFLVVPPTPTASQRQRIVVFGKATVASLAIALLFYGTVTFINARLSQYPTFPLQQILAHDLVAISIAEGEVLLPTEVNRPPFTLEELRAIYDPDSIVYLYCCNDAPRWLERFHREPNAIKLAALERQWLTVVPAHWDDYFRHRFAVFTSMMGVGRETVCIPLEHDTGPNDYGVVFTRNPTNYWFTLSVFFPLQNTWIFRVWVYAVLNLVVLVLIPLAPRSQRIPIVVLGASGFIYTSLYIFIATACDLRMNYWLIVSTLVAAALYLGENRTDTPRTGA